MRKGGKYIACHTQIYDEANKEVFISSCEIFVVTSFLNRHVRLSVASKVKCNVFIKQNPARRDGHDVSPVKNGYSKSQEQTEHTR